MIYIESQDTRSDYNLALEQYVFEQMPKGESCFMLWRNSPSVIIGKHQNTVEELNVSYVKENGIRVTRRLSGGGAVYHDLGNINYTYITGGKPDASLDLSRFCSPLMNVLEHLGIPAEFSGRNDILVDGKKVSGNAQYCKNGRIMHHGTILYDSDLAVLSKVLRVTEDKIRSKGIKSVRSRVANIKDYMQKPVCTETFLSILRREMCRGFDVKEYRLCREDAEAVERIRLERYAAWDWNWGASPNFTISKKRKVEGCGNIQICLEVEKGRIKDCRFYGDYFGDGPSEEVLRALDGSLMKYDELQNRLEKVDIRSCFLNLSKEQLIDLLVQ